MRINGCTHPSTSINKCRDDAWLHRNVSWNNDTCCDLIILFGRTVLFICSNFCCSGCSSTNKAGAHPNARATRLRWSGIAFSVTGPEKKVRRVNNGCFQCLNTRWYRRQRPACLDCLTRRARYQGSRHTWMVPPLPSGERLPIQPHIRGSGAQAAVKLARGRHGQREARALEGVVVDGHVAVGRLHHPRAH